MAASPLGPLCLPGQPRVRGDIPRERVAVPGLRAWQTVLRLPLLLGLGARRRVWGIGLRA